MAVRLPPRGRLLYAVCLVVLAAAGLGLALLLVQWGRRPAARGSGVPSVGVNIGQKLSRAGVDIDQMAGPYGVLLFLGRDAMACAPSIWRACDSLQRSGFDLYVFLAGIDTGRTWEGKARAVMWDPKGEIRALFGVQEAGSGVVVFQKSGTLSWGQRSGLTAEQLARELVSRTTNLWPTGRSGLGSEAAEAAAGDSVASFPFDSLAQHATRIEVDLDKLGRRALHVLATVGDKEVPVPGEPFFAKPEDMAIDGQGRVLVVDSHERVVFVLDGEGRVIGRLGGPGQGPGELARPMALACDQRRVLVAEACCALHEFDLNLAYRRTIRWPVGAGGAGKGFVLVSGVAVIAQPPIPPDRPHVLHLYHVGVGQAYPVAGFLPYARPKRQYHDAQLQYAALASRNMIALASDCGRFLVVYRAAEREVTVWDLQTKTAYVYLLKGKKILTEVNRHRAPNLPEYATKMVVRAMAATREGQILCLVCNYGLLRLDALSSRPVLTYVQEAEVEYRRSLEYYDRVEAF